MTKSTLIDINEKEISDEILNYKKLQKAILNKTPKNQLPTIPENRHAQNSNLLIAAGSLIHPCLWVMIKLMQVLRCRQLAIACCRLRIKTDFLSYEPVSCGLNRAYTHLGTILLSMEKIQDAINCLDLSWRVHPCPHNTSYGLSPVLARKLLMHPRAESSVNEYIRIGRQFTPWPDSWERKIRRPVV